MRACEKRPISVNQLETIADEIERNVQDTLDRELPTSEIGKVIIKRLKAVDNVAYVRFASVYLAFEAAGEFMNELKDLVRARKSVRKKEKAKPKK